MAVAARNAAPSPLNRTELDMMNDELQQRVAEALRNPRNMGELPDADATGTVGNSECGEMLRMWIKYREERGRKVIDRATFQSFGCETAIAVASLATELIRGKTAEEALALPSEQLAGELGALPPLKIHCAELVQGALRSALEPAGSAPGEPESPAAPVIPGLADRLAAKQAPQGVKLVFLDDDLPA